MVALLAEGVDRNCLAHILRRQQDLVALLAEGVDRNSLIVCAYDEGKGRPPRGGRG